MANGLISFSSIMKKITQFLSNNSTYAIAIVRVITGLLMIYHGKEVFDGALLEEYAKWDQFKSFSNPLLIATIGKATEFICGILLAFGFLTRIGALLLILSMLYITFFIGKGEFWYADQHPFMFVLLGIIYLFAGGGHWSLDQKFSKQ